MSEKTFLESIMEGNGFTEAGMGRALLIGAALVPFVEQMESEGMKPSEIRDFLFLIVKSLVAQKTPKQRR